MKGQQTVNDSGFTGNILDLFVQSLAEVASAVFFVAIILAVAVGFIIKFQVAAWAPECGSTHERWVATVILVNVAAGFMAGLGLWAVPGHTILSVVSVAVTTPLVYLVFVAAMPHRFKYFLLTGIGWRWYSQRKRGHE